MTNTTTTTNATACDSDGLKDVNARFRPSELAAMKKRTGVITDAGAVAAFCRVNLAAQGLLDA